MRINQQHYRTIWADARCKYVQVIDQTKLPFAFEVLRIDNLEQMAHAIATMQVRGAPLIGAAAAYGMALAMLHDDSDNYVQEAAQTLVATRPTAVNLQWAVARMVERILEKPQTTRNMTAWKEAAKIAEEDVAQNQAIGEHGLKLIKKAAENKVINIMTHCNAGWLATVDFGTALAPIYAAHDAGLKVHVWVSETRPRNQGAALTAWELAQHRVPHTVITDNAAGHLLQRGAIDMVIVGADRVTASGDVCNKIGTYLKALAAYDNGIPFYAAVPSPTIDWKTQDHKHIEIEARHGDEVAYIEGLGADGSIQKIRLVPQESDAVNPAFDVTPARLVTAIVTERGIYAPQQLSELLKMR